MKNSYNYIIYIYSTYDNVHHHHIYHDIYRHLQAMKLQASKIALMNALTFYTKGLEMSCKEKPPRPAWTAVEAVD